MNKTRDKSRGQIAVLYAGVIAILLGAVALGSDVALMYANWERVQKTADAAAVAGANFLSSGMSYGGTIAAGCTGDNAEEAACTYAMTNDPALANTGNGVTVSEPNRNSLLVVATETDPYFFAKALNIIPGVSMNTYTGDRQRHRERARSCRNRSGGRHGSVPGRASMRRTLSRGIPGRWRIGPLWLEVCRRSRNGQLAMAGC